MSAIVDQGCHVQNTKKKCGLKNLQEHGELQDLSVMLKE